MSIFYPSGCDDAAVSHVCDPCPEAEGGRIRNVAFIHTSWVFVDITDPAEWAAAVAAGKAIVIASVRGTYDGGAPTFGPGFGDLINRKTGKNFKINFTDPNLKGNCAAYNALGNSHSWRIAFTSASVLQISDKAGTIDAKDPVTDAVDSERYWEVEVTFSQRDNPCHNDIPAGIFTCFEVL